MFKLLTVTVTLFAAVKISQQDDWDTPSAEEIAIKFQQAKITPNVIDTAPRLFLNVKYPQDIRVKLGTNVPFGNALYQPEVSWPSAPGDEYTLIFFGPQEPIQNELQLGLNYWTVVNIKDSDVFSGNTYTTYGKPPNLPDTGKFTVAMLIFRQSYHIEPSTAQLTDEVTRNMFDVRTFAIDNGLSIYAGNFAYTYPVIITPQ